MAKYQGSPDKSSSLQYINIALEWLDSFAKALGFSF